MGKKVETEAPVTESTAAPDERQLIPEAVVSDTSVPEVVQPVPTLVHHRSQRLLQAVLALAGLTIIWLGLGYFGAHTQVGSLRLPSHASNQAYQWAFKQQGDAARINIVRPDKQSNSYKLSDIGISINTAASTWQARRWQQGWAGRFMWWRTTPTQAVLSVNETALNDFIEKKTTIIAQPSKDALLTIENGEIKVADAVTGKQFGLPDSRKQLLVSAQQLHPSTLHMTQLALNPAVTTASLQPYKAKLESVLGQDIRFEVQGRTVNASAVDIADWLDISPDPKTKKINIAINSGKISAYIDSITKRYVREAKAQVEVDAGDNQEPRVLVQGVDGFAVTNKDDAAIKVSKAVQDATGSDETLNIEDQPFKTIKAGDYNKWIEINVTSKRMYLYEHDQLVSTWLVSAGAPATPTVLGQYAVYSKFTQQDMRGQNVDGSSYYQPNVRWISYFYRDYAIHGNYWRPLSWFGNINSSHGCVSLPNDQAKTVYDWAVMGTPVIVHT